MRDFQDIEITWNWEEGALSPYFFESKVEKLLVWMFRKSYVALKLESGFYNGLFKIY